MTKNLFLTRRDLLDEPKGAKNTHPIDQAGFVNREFMCYFMHDGCAQMAEIGGRNPAWSNAIW